MQRTVTAKRFEKEIVLVLSDTYHYLELESDYTSWQTFLTQRFEKVIVEVAGYTDLYNGGFHIMRMLFPEDIDEVTKKSYIQWIEDICEEKEVLPECAPQQFQKKKIYSSISSFFNELITDYSSITRVTFIYGVNWLDDYLSNIASQKHIQSLFSPNKKDGILLRKEALYIYTYVGLDDALDKSVISFINSFKGLFLLQNPYCEAYEGIEEGQTSGIVHILLHWTLSSQVLKPEGAFKFIQGLLKKKSEESNLKKLSWEIEDLHFYWKGCSKIVNLTQKDKYFQDFVEKTSFDLENYSTRMLQNPKDNINDGKSMKSFSSRKSSGANNRVFFSLQLKEQYNQKVFEELESKLRSASSNVDCIRVYHCEQTDQQQVCIIMKESTQGEHRQWFIVASRRGYKVLQDQGMQVEKQSDCLCEEEFFKKEQPSFIVFGDNKPFTCYLQRQLQLKSGASKGLEEKETVKVLLQKFHQGLKEGKYKSIEDIREEYSDNVEALVKFSDKEKAMKDLVHQFVSSSYKKLPEKDRLVSLQEFIKRYPFTQEQKPLTDKYLKEVGLYEILKAVLDVIVIAKDSKLGTIVLHGAPNSGKSSIMKIINDIFICDYMLQTQGNFDIVPEFKPFKFQVVLSEETDFNKLLKDTHINNTKLFFERKGRPIEGKGKGAIWLYQGAANILASQYFPVHLLQTLNQEAITTRCVIVELKKSHSLSQKFPLSANQVAEWLLRSFQQETSEIHGEMSDEEADEELSEENGEVSATEELNQSFEMKPLPLKPPTMLGKKKRTQKTGLNSEKVVKRTKREIEWNQQETLDKFTVPIKQEKEEEKTLSLQETYENMKSQLEYYYSGKSFPYHLVHKIFINGFREREFAYYTIRDGREFWKRGVSFHSPESLKERLTKEVPYAVYSGGVYEQATQAYTSMNQAKLAATDLVFDLDLDAYDDMRTCGCRGKSVCDQCWCEFIVPAVKIIDKVIREDYKYKYLLWTFSGGRGVHLRVFDEEARHKDSQERELVLCAIKAEAEREGFEMKLDECVTKDLKRILRLPFSIHSGSGLLVVPFDPKEVEFFKVSEVPDYKKAAYDFREVDKYTHVLKKVFFSQFNKSQGSYRTFKSDDRNPFICDNTEVQGTDFQDIWLLIENGINKYKSMMFWFQIRRGTLEYQERWELMKFFKQKGVSFQRCSDFFKSTMPREKFEDKDNKIPQQIQWVYEVYKK